MHFGFIFVLSFCLIDAVRIIEKRNDRILDYDSLWMYSNVPQTTDDWKTKNMGWEKTKQFPIVTTITRYFRATVSTESREYVFAYIASVKTNTGFILYINGDEVFRWNMPQQVNSTTPASSTSAKVVERSYSTLGELIRSSNYSSVFEVAIEVHATEKALYADETFDAQVIFVIDDNYRRIVGEGDVSASQWTPSDHKASMAIDNNTETKLSFPDITGDRRLIWTFPNDGRELINKYSITTANDYPKRDPISWNVYGSNDHGRSWMLVDSRSDMVWSSRGETAYFSLYQYISFNSYKLTILAKKNPSSAYFQIAEWGLFLSNISHVPISLSYPQEKYRLAINIDYVSIHPTIVMFTNWEISEALTLLPEGIAFNTTTGVFSGKPVGDADSRVFVVSADSTIDRKRYTTTIEFDLYSCSLPSYIYVEFSKTNDDEPNERYEVFDSSKTSVLKYDASVPGSIFICLPCAVYTVELSSIQGSRWISSSFLTVTSVINYIASPLVKARMYGDSTLTFVFNLQIVTSPLLTYPVDDSKCYDANSNCYFYYTGNSIPSDWMSSSFQPTNWMIFHSNITETTSFRYVFYTTQFMIHVLSDFQGFELRVFEKSAILVYLNGQFVFKHMLNSTVVTNTTMPLGEDMFYSWSVVTLPLSILHTGLNRLSVCIVRMSTLEDYLMLDIQGRLLTNSNVFPRYFSYSSNQMSLFDQLQDTRLYEPIVNDTLSITFNLPYGQKETFNKYCLRTNWDSPRSDPMDWYISGCNDNTCSMLESVSGIEFERRLTEYCFYIPFNSQAYETYVFTITRVKENDPGNYYALCELDYYLVNLNAITIPELMFSPSNLVGYVDELFPVVPANSLYYTSFSIEPDLPFPLKINRSNGAISGIVEVEIPTSKYVVTAVNQRGEVKSTIITITILACTSDKVFFTLEFYLDSGASKCSFALRELESNSIVEERPYLRDYDYFTIPVCRDGGTYALVLSKTDTTGWGKNKVNVVLEDGLVLLSESLATGRSTKEYNFNPTFLIPPSSSSWYYLVSGAEAPAGWNAIDTAPSNWKQAKAGSFPPATGVTQYYYHRFVLQNLTNYAVLDVSISVKAGAILYLNGVVLRRINMAEYGVTYKTAATKEEDVSMQITTGELIQHNVVRTGSNLIAVELHRYIGNEEKNSFDGSAILLLDNMYMLLEGTGSTTPEGDEVGDGSCKAVDNNSDTMTFIKNQCVGVEVLWSFIFQRREPISRYGIVAGGSCNTRHPSAWILYGSNGEKWVPLHDKSGQTFNQPYESLRYDFYNDVAYNQYKIIVTECKNTEWSSDKAEECGSNNFQMADFYLFTRRLEGFCEAEDGFNRALNGDSSYVKCPDLYEGYISRKCNNGVWGGTVHNCKAIAPKSVIYSPANITMYQGVYLNPVIPTIVAADYSVKVFPTLPDGVVFNNQTGAISGLSQAVVSERYFSVVVVNSNGDVKTMISIEVLSRGIDWFFVFTLISLVLLNLFGLVIIILIFKKKREEENLEVEVR